MKNRWALFQKGKAADYIKMEMHLKIHSLGDNLKVLLETPPDRNRKVSLGLNDKS